LTEFDWVSSVFTWFYGFLLGFTRFYWVLLGFPWFYLVLLGFTGFYRVLLGCAGLYCVLPSFTGLFWVLLGLHRSELSEQLLGPTLACLALASLSIDVRSNGCKILVLLLLRRPGDGLQRLRRLVARLAPGK